MVPERYKDYTNAIFACKNRVRLLVTILDAKVDDIGTQDDKDLLYGVIGVLRDLDADLEIMTDEPYMELEPI